MAGQTTWNKATVPAGTDPWNAVPDVKKALDTSGLVFSVANTAERNGLAALAPAGVLPIPTLVWRADVQAYESWDGTAWTRGANIALGATFNAFSATYGTPAYEKGISGRVTLSGLLGTTAANITMAAATQYTLGTLPTGYRPAKDALFRVLTSTAMGGVGSLYVLANGDILFENSAAFTSLAQTNFYVGLDGLNWLAA